MSTSKQAHANKTPAQKDQYFYALRSIQQGLNPTVTEEEKKGDIYPTNNRELQTDIEFTVEPEEESGATNAVAKKEKPKNRVTKKSYNRRKKPKKIDSNLKDNLFTIFLTLLTVILIPLYILLNTDVSVMKEKFSNFERRFNSLETKIEKVDDKMSNTAIDIEVIKRTSNKK